MLFYDDVVVGLLKRYRTCFHRCHELRIVVGILRPPQDIADKVDNWETGIAELQPACIETSDVKCFYILTDLLLPRHLQALFEVEREEAVLLLLKG